MAVKTVVPSDITVLEEKTKIGARRLGLLEWTGLLFQPPMLHIYSRKMDRNDMRAVLQRRFDEDSSRPSVIICRKRQESVRKHVVANNYMWGTGFGITGLTWWSVRRYKKEACLLALPFVLYGGSSFGRVLGDVCTGRNAEYYRDRVLFNLPAKVYHQ
eukprot:TRINITY_DN32011_c0_g1_i1.p1 TRINITY_DN32011_c0_g1~~TRINITY_DN32011_c0_g1_i1.p1  ORF type:complete len:180 (-),score=33.57 TRINITY_DN32011_c0_g1_i1:130-603(-)